MSLKFIALSGTVGVNENLYVYEYGDDMIIVDCGVGFPDLEMHGVDLVIPDFTYIKENVSRLKGIFVSQGHEDHQGALPFLLREIDAPPIYAPPLVAAFIEDKFKEFDIKNYKMHVYNPDTDVLKVGAFTITPFRVNHSIPDTVGLAIDTPTERIFHVAEHKFDPDPVDGFPFDEAKARKLAEEKKPVFLAGDCLGASKEGSVPPEKPIEKELEKLMQDQRGAIYATVISSNIGRMQQVINIAERTGRKVCLIGRSIISKGEMAHELKYLQYKNDTILSLKQAQSKNPSEMIYIIAGCYGQVGSSLYRLALGEHNNMQLEKGDRVIFLANPAPPYTKESIDFVVDALIDHGAEVFYYDNIHNDVYVSGHGGQDDIVHLWDIVKPDYLIPVGGTIRFMHAFEELAEKHGYDSEHILKLKPGDILKIENGSITRDGKITVKEVLVDGLGIGDVGRVMLEDRKVLGEHGVAVVLVHLDKSGRSKGLPDIISRGFVFQKEEQDFLRDSSKYLADYLQKEKNLDRNKAKAIARSVLAEYFMTETGRKPLIVPVVVES